MKNCQQSQFGVGIKRSVHQTTIKMDTAKLSTKKSSINTISANILQFTAFRSGKGCKYGKYGISSDTAPAHTVFSCAICLLGFLASWLSGHLSPWLRGFLASWLPGFFTCSFIPLISNHTSRMIIITIIMRMIIMTTYCFPGSMVLWSSGAGPRQTQFFQQFS